MSPEIFPPARPVRAGGHLRIVAPSGPFDRERFEAGVTWLRDRYLVSYSDAIHSRSGYFAGPDERRLFELNEAVHDDTVDAILCARGGYGATRILPGIDRAAVRRANKMIIGFSDVTALHAVWAGAGVRSIHAPMAASLALAPPEIRQAWVESVENQTELSRWELQALSLLDHPVAGRFFGGNLAVLHALVGTPYAPPLDGVILFLEDVGERPYRIDRMLTTLDQAGWFVPIAGVVLGSFTQGDPAPDGVSIDDVFAHHFAGRPFPVLRGFPAGHIEENQPIGFGTRAVIEGPVLHLTH